MQITLSQFEAIDSAFQEMMRLGSFETCADPRKWIRSSNVLLDACIDALGLDYVNNFASAEECAANVITQALLSADMVVDA